MSEHKYSRERFGPMLRRLRKAKGLMLRQVPATKVMLNHDWGSVLGLSDEERQDLRVAMLLSSGGFTMAFEGEPTDTDIRLCCALILGTTKFGDEQWRQVIETILRTYERMQGEVAR